LTKEIAKNEMIVRIDRQPRTKLPANYEFCLKAPENVFLTFIQSSSLLFLPEATTVMVVGTMNFTFYSEGKSILEINECKSRAVTTVYHEFSTSDRVNSQIKQVRRTNNIVEFMYYGPVYVETQAKSATLGWRKKDEEKKLGYGYDQYYPSKLRYEYLPVEGQLRVTVFPLSRSTTNEIFVEFPELTYTVYLAAEEMNLYEAINCENGVYAVKSKTEKGRPEFVEFIFNVSYGLFRQRRLRRNSTGRSLFWLGLLSTALPASRMMGSIGSAIPIRRSRWPCWKANR
jgi:hypothetical protein